MTQLFFNDKRMEFVPVTYGKENDDLYSLNATQIRHYNFDTSSIKNTPNSGDAQWFTVELRMQDKQSGSMTLLYDDGGMFINWCAAGHWQGWKEVAFK